MPTYIQLPDQDSAARFAIFNRRLYAFDIWSSNRYQTRVCNAIHAMSVKTRPTKLTALKLAFNFIFFRVWINTPLSKLLIGLFTRPEKPNGLFIHEEWDSHGIIYISQAAFDLRNKYGGQRSVAKLKQTFDRKPVLLWPILPYQQLFRFLLA